MFGTITAPNGLWLHRSPNSRDTSRIVLMPVDSRVVIMPEAEANSWPGWLRVEWDGHEGYAFGQWIKRDPDLAVLPTTSGGRLALGLVLIVLVILLASLWARGARAGGWGIEVDAATAEHLCSRDGFCRVQWSRCWVRDCSDAPYPTIVPDKTTTEVHPVGTVCLGGGCAAAAACPDGYELVLRQNFQRACARDLQEVR